MTMTKCLASAPSYTPPLRTEQIFVPEDHELSPWMPTMDYLGNDFVVTRERGRISGARYLTSMNYLMVLIADGYTFELRQCESGVYAYVPEPK